MPETRRQKAEIDNIASTLARLLRNNPNRRVRRGVGIKIKEEVSEQTCTTLPAPRPPTVGNESKKRHSESEKDGKREEATTGPNPKRRRIRRRRTPGPPSSSSVSVGAPGSSESAQKQKEEERAETATTTTTTKDCILSYYLELLQLNNKDDDEELIALPQPSGQSLPANVVDQHHAPRKVNIPAGFENALISDLQNPGAIHTFCMNLRSHVSERFVPSQAIFIMLLDLLENSNSHTDIVTITDTLKHILRLHPPSKSLYPFVWTPNTPPMEMNKEETKSRKRKKKDDEEEGGDEANDESEGGDNDDDEEQERKRREEKRREPFPVKFESLLKFLSSEHEFKDVEVVSSKYSDFKQPKVPRLEWVEFLSKYNYLEYCIDIFAEDLAYRLSFSGTAEFATKMSQSELETFFLAKDGNHNEHRYFNTVIGYIFDAVALYAHRKPPLGLDVSRLMMKLLNQMAITLFLNHAADREGFTRTLYQQFKDKLLTFEQKSAFLLNFEYLPARAHLLDYALMENFTVPNPRNFFTELRKRLDAKGLEVGKGKAGLLTNDDLHTSRQYATERICRRFLFVYFHLTEYEMGSDSSEHVANSQALFFFLRWMCNTLNDPSFSLASAIAELMKPSAAAATQQDHKETPANATVADVPISTVDTDTDGNKQMLLASPASATPLSDESASPPPTDERPQREEQQQEEQHQYHGVANATPLTMPSTPPSKKNKQQQQQQRLQRPPLEPRHWRFVYEELVEDFKLLHDRYESLRERYQHQHEDEDERRRDDKYNNNSSSNSRSKEKNGGETGEWTNINLMYEVMRQYELRDLIREAARKAGDVQQQQQHTQNQ